MIIVVSERRVYCFAGVGGHGSARTKAEKNMDGTIKIIILYPSLAAIDDGRVRRAETILLLLLWLRYNNILLAHIAGRLF